MSDDPSTDSIDHDVDVRLREVLDADLEAFLAYEHDPEALRRSRFTPRPRDTFMKHWRTSVLGDETCLVRTVLVGDDVAGSVVSWWDGERRFLGYWLGRPYWGRGVGTKALALFLDTERIRPLYADPFHANTASVRLLEHHGFQRAGTVRRGDDEHVLLVLSGPPR
ncbi:GNAT family N-acetyltransferase [Streptomyces ferrugineus]|uniref:GNAT family N-acetyltransferase n=1 Tax=Streptomyces ferrugineus TaxID=1413221 RepID=A0A7M2SJJ6_9ACTN|nr:GNAT family N-acetyltransferase [Streptomyces ferrugineus]QOV35905.1 GNAT family N-acetyltransferase [Streptomyces ferrugineus]